MSDENRRREMLDSIERMLAEDVITHHLDAGGRLAWLSHHLGLYVGRFCGFAEAYADRLADMLDSDLFAAVEVGTERLALELRSVGAPALLFAEWTRYTDVVRLLQTAPTAHGVADLRLAIGAWEVALAGAEP